ncbi:MAG: hypothetical protein LUH04_17185, partial [Clostridium sp.]|nr:hypothetical protein [Clostridium sp.]
RIYFFDKDNHLLYSFLPPKLDSDYLRQFMNGQLSTEETIAIIKEYPRLFYFLRKECRTVEICRERLDYEINRSKDSKDDYNYCKVIDGTPHKELILESVQKFYQQNDRLPNFSKFDNAGGSEFIKFLIDRDKYLFLFMGDEIKTPAICLYQIKTHPDTDLTNIPEEVKTGNNIYTVNQWIEMLSGQSFSFEEISDFYNGTGNHQVIQLNTIENGVSYGQEVIFDKKAGELIFFPKFKNEEIKKEKNAHVKSVASKRQKKIR